jgi:NADH-quinone oxidoreductase subunit L
MLALVTAADFMQLFFGWEGVGLASYLLIGFWYKKPSASAAAIKAFVVNRVGDFGFALGIFTVFWMFGTINFAELFPMIASARPGTTWEFLGHAWSAIDLARRLPAVHRRHGQVGAVLPAHLAAGRHGRPDPGVGPDPRGDHGHRRRLYGLPAVAALRIRADTPRWSSPSSARSRPCSPRPSAGRTTSSGSSPIRPVRSSATCSSPRRRRLWRAMFHLFTHAFFKALLFLGAGSVIHGMHHEQDMRKMGGLWKLLPITYAVMVIGTIAITGLGIPASAASPASTPRTRSSRAPSPRSPAATPMGLFRLLHRHLGRRSDQPTIRGG